MLIKKDTLEQLFSCRIRNFGSTFAYEAAKRGNHVKVIEKRDHIGGNIYTKKIDGIDVHMYGAHIFHTKMKDIWDYINQFATFNNFVNKSSG